MKETEFFECDCSSDEHTLKFNYNGDCNEFYTSIYLNQCRNIFKRIWIAIKYIFGYKCKYGHWDCFILKEHDTNRLIDMLKIVNERKSTDVYATIDGKLIFADNIPELIEKLNVAN